MQAEFGITAVIQLRDANVRVEHFISLIFRDTASEILFQFEIIKYLIQNLAFQTKNYCQVNKSIPHSILIFE
jgi:hypothetical protein